MNEKVALVEQSPPRSKRQEAEISSDFTEIFGYKVYSEEAIRKETELMFEEIRKRKEKESAGKKEQSKEKEIEMPETKYNYIINYSPPRYGKSNDNLIIDEDIAKDLSKLMDEAINQDDYYDYYEEEKIEFFDESIFYNLKREEEK